MPNNMYYIMRSLTREKLCRQYIFFVYTANIETQLLCYHSLHERSQGNLRIDTFNGLFQMRTFNRPTHITTTTANSNNGIGHQKLTHIQL